MKNYLPLLICFFAINFINGQTQGPFFPTAYTTSGSGASWGNLGGVAYVDNSPAYVDLAQYPTCNSFICYHSNMAEFKGFGFTIPLNATITGIEVEILQRVNSPGGGIHDSILMLALNGNTFGYNYASPFNWLDTPNQNYYGASSDTWGYIWTPAQINDSTFGLNYMITDTSYDQAASVDHLVMTVHYQTGSGIFSQTSNPWIIGFSNATLRVSGESSFIKSGGRILIVNTNGALVAEKVFEPGADRLDIGLDASLWSSGLYSVNILSNSGNRMYRKVMLSR